MRSAKGLLHICDEHAEGAFVPTDAFMRNSPTWRLDVLGDILLPKFSLMPAVAFYLFYPVGLVVFAVSPALKAGSGAKLEEFLSNKPGPAWEAFQERIFKKALVGACWPYALCWPGAGLTGLGGAGLGGEPLEDQQRMPVGDDAAARAGSNVGPKRLGDCSARVLGQIQRREVDERLANQATAPDQPGEPPALRLPRGQRREPRIGPLTRLFGTGDFGYAAKARVSSAPNRPSGAIGPPDSWRSASSDRPEPAPRRPRPA